MFLFLYATIALQSIGFVLSVYEEILLMKNIVTNLYLTSCVRQLLPLHVFQ